MAVKGWGSAKNIIPKGLALRADKVDEVKEVEEVQEVEEKKRGAGEFCCENTRNISMGLSEK